ncbi:MAG: hypothetical protein U0075_10920 [Thermomicrobiales bacterium]
MTRTRNLALLLALGLGTITLGLTQALPAASQDAADSEAAMASAMAAGPLSITDHATIMAVDGTTVLQEGTNGWTCFPDANATPAEDPMCLDETWMGWLAAISTGTEPDTQVVGLAYMLGGGSDASNTDPFAAEPEEGNAWITSPAHVMVIMPGAIDQTVFTTDPLSGEPFIMWAGTPYEHLMMPVDAHAMVEMGTMGEMSMGAMASATPTP